GGFPTDHEWRYQILRRRWRRAWETPRCRPPGQSLSPALPTSGQDHGCRFGTPWPAKPVHNAMSKYIRNRTDIGAGRAMRDGVLEPSNPFERKAARPRATRAGVEIGR